MRVKSAIDWWLGGLIWLVIFAIIAGMLPSLAEEEKAIGYGVAIPMVAFLLSLFFCTYYELRDDHLFCRSGPLFERIPYDCIKSVKLSNSLLSGMALSMRRIAIRKHDSWPLGVTLISPPNREEFMQELLSRCQNLG